jgi:glycosyltransferase involved in cell wall biosynthesis
MALSQAIGEQFDVHVLTTDTDHGDSIPYPGIHTNEWLYNPELKCHINYLSRKNISHQAVHSVIRRCQADFVYVSTFFSPYFVITPVISRLLGFLSGQWIICPRGTLYQSALERKNIPKRFLLLFFRMLGLGRKFIFHATNPKEEQAIHEYFPNARIKVIDNLGSSEMSKLHLITKSSGSLRIIFASRIVPIKNLSYLLDRLAEVKGELQLSICGPVEDETYWAECQKKIESLKQSGISVDFLGPINPVEISRLIGTHHIFMLPTAGENFGHAILESLAAGRPVLISDQTPWRHLESKAAGWDLSLAEPARFTQTLQKLADMDQSEWENWARGSYKLATEFKNRQTEEVNKYRMLFN